MSFMDDEAWPDTTQDWLNRRLEAITRDTPVPIESLMNFKHSSVSAGGRPLGVCSNCSTNSSTSSIDESIDFILNPLKLSMPLMRRSSL